MNQPMPQPLVIDANVTSLVPEVRREQPQQAPPHNTLPPQDRRVLLESVLLAVRGAPSALYALLNYSVVFALLGIFWTASGLEGSETTQILTTVVLGAWIVFRRGAKA